MGLTKSVLKRPVTVVMVILCLIVFGLQSVLGAKLELMPTMEMPVLIVYSVYPGASPEDVNDLVSTKIEKEIGSLSGVDTIQSRSMENVSLVIIQYDYGKDIDEAYDDLKKKMDALEGDLPDDCNAPVIMEMNIDEMDTMSLSVNNKAQSDLYNYVNNKIVPEFEKITTVTDVSISGGQKEYIQIQLIPEKLEQYHLNLASVATAIGSADFTYPAGDTIVGGQKLSVSAGTKYDSEELLKSIPLNLENGNVIYLSDVANVQMAKEDASSIARYNGEDTISIGIKKQQSASAVDVSKAVKKTIKNLTDADENLEIITVSDTSDEINSSLKSVMQTMVMAVMVSMLIIFLFFGEIKASLIVGTSIPISILAALILIQVMGFSLNVVTLSSLVLGVGMMVDNSIVVLESCFRSTKGKGIVGYREAALERHCAAVNYRKYRDHLCCIPAAGSASGPDRPDVQAVRLYDHLLYGGIPHQCNDHRSALLLLLPPAGEGGISGRCFDPCHAEWLSQHHEGAAEEKENRPLHFCCIAGGCLLDGFSAAHGADGFR